MNDLLDEVQEFQKQEFVSKFLKKYGKMIIGACVVIVICTAFWVYFNNKTENAQKDFSIKFYELYKTNNVKELEKLLSNKAQGFSDIAEIKLSLILSSKNQYKEAQKILMNLYKTSNYEAISNYSLYLYGMNAVYNNNQQEMQNFLNITKHINNNAFNKLLSFVEILCQKEPNERETLIEKIKSKSSNDSNFIGLLDIIQN